MVITGVLARIAERIASIVSVDAFVPDDGKSLVGSAFSTLAAATVTRPCRQSLLVFRHHVHDPEVAERFFPGEVKILGVGRQGTDSTNRPSSTTEVRYGVLFPVVKREHPEVGITFSHPREVNVLLDHDIPNAGSVRNELQLAALRRHTPQAHT